MPKYNIADIDIDCANREEILSGLKHIPASKINEKGITPHNIGVYFSDIPVDDFTGLASIDYKRAEEEFGYVKIDFLHNTIYDNFKSNQEIKDILKKPVNWDMLKNKKIVESLPHINNYFDKLQELPPITNEIELAMFLALIRPAKIRYYDRVKTTQDWNSIKDNIWAKELGDDGYRYKKAHAIAYALSIIVVMNSLNVNDLENDDWLIYE
jgi:hypothetical protein